MTIDRRRPHLTSCVLESKRPLVVSEVDAAFLQSIAQSAEHLRVLHKLDPKFVMAVPLFAHGHLLGAVVVASSGRRYDGQDDATGLRPSTLRPLRRASDTPDVLWGEGVVLIRRSHTRKQEVMEKPKTGLRQRLTLPEELMEVLEWHVDRIPEGPTKESELLFPSETGGFRSPSCVDKPFEEVVTELKLKKRVTPRAMRRTFQDLGAAEVKERRDAGSVGPHDRSHAAALLDGLAGRDA